MELFSLILVNLTLGVVLYFVFSLRLSRALDKAKAGEIPGDVRRSIQATMDNLQSTVEFVNTSLDIMEKKTTTFYRLVRRAEELSIELEELIGKTKGRRIRRKDGSSPGAEGGQGRESAAGPVSGSNQRPKSRVMSTAQIDSEDTRVERVLAGLRNDSVDLGLPGSSEEIFRSSAMSSADSVFLTTDSSPSGIAPQMGGFLSGIGKMAARFLGFKGIDASQAPSIPGISARLTETSKSDTTNHHPGFHDVLDEVVQPARPAPIKPAPKITVEDRVEISRESSAFYETVKNQDLPPRDMAMRLLAGGHKPEAVAQATGMGLPELALLGSLPRNLERPRRKRLHVESAF